jgi:hypothetical protein
MRKKQLGLSLGGLLAGAVVFIALALLVVKLMPSYMEFFAVKKVVTSIAMEKRGAAASVADVRRSFDLRATVDDIRTISGADLEVTKEGSDVVISASYRKEVPLFGNVGLYINFAANSNQ